MKTACFTGHRSITVTPELQRKLTNIIELLIQNGVTDFFAGAALGWDTLCECTVIDLKQKYPHVRLHIILPCPGEEQTQKWAVHDKAVFNEILKLADSSVCTCAHYTKNCMKLRNIRLVELSDCCICYYTGKFASGTGQTVRLAQNKGIQIFNLYEM